MVCAASRILWAASGGVWVGEKAGRRGVWCSVLCCYSLLAPCTWASSRVLWEGCKSLGVHQADPVFAGVARREGYGRQSRRLIGYSGVAFIHPDVQGGGHPKSKKRNEVCMECWKEGWRCRRQLVDGAMVRLIYRASHDHVGASRQMSASEFLCRSIQCGIYEKPSRAFKKGRVVELGNVAQTMEDLELTEADIETGPTSGIYQEIKLEHARCAPFAEAVIILAFVIRQERDGERSGRVVVSLSMQPNHWAKGSLRVKTLSEFAMSVQLHDRMLWF